MFEGFQLWAAIEPESHDDHACVSGVDRDFLCTVQA